MAKKKLGRVILITNAESTESGKHLMHVERLRQAVRESAISLNHLGKLAGVHNSQLSRFMRGKNDLSFETAAKLFDVLNLELTSTKKIELKKSFFFEAYFAIDHWSFPPMPPRLLPSDCL